MTEGTTTGTAAFAGQRRTFLRGAGLAALGGVAGLAGAGLIPAARAAASLEDSLGALAGRLLYTRDAPGRWAGKEGGHTPVMSVTGGAVTIVTPHEMADEHYIVKHMLLDGDMALLGERMFDKAVDIPESTHALGGYTGAVYAVSVCNKHDTWVSWMTV